MIRMWILFAALGFILPLPAVFAQAGVPPKTGEAKQAFPPQAIIAASYRGDENMVRDILAAGADKDARDALGATALHAAMYQTNLAVIKMLLDYGFDPNVKDTKRGYTPLHCAVTANNPEAAQLLLQYHANRNIRSLDKMSPLEKARKEDKQEMVRVLIR